MADPAPAAPLCPSCAYREADDSGWCRPCNERAALSRYQDKKAVEVETRRRSWAERTAGHRSLTQSPEALKERQHQHRLKKRLRPREIAAHADPLELGASALRRLARVRQSLGAKWSVQQAALREIEELEELVRQLAFGPLEEEQARKGEAPS